ncbi:MAG: tail fiber domain-containing protein [Luteibacter sp.]
MAQQTVNFNPSTGDDTSGALRKLDNNVNDHENRFGPLVVSVAGKADKTYVDAQDAQRLPVANPVFSGAAGISKKGVANQFCFQVNNAAGEGGIGGAFSDWSGAQTPGLQLDAMNDAGQYMGIRWTHWGVRHNAAIHAYAGGTTSSSVSIGFHFDVGINRHVFNANGSAVFAGALTQNSDYRIKDAVSPILPTDAAASLRQAKPIEYHDNRDVSDAKRRAGFIAHELQPAFPLLVTGEKDAWEWQLAYAGDLTPYLPGEEPEGWVEPTPYPVKAPVLQSVDYVALGPYLTAAWQEHDDRIAALEADNGELRSALTALLDRVAALEAR